MHPQIEKQHWTLEFWYISIYKGPIKKNLNKWTFKESDDLRVTIVPANLHSPPTAETPWNLDFGCWWEVLGGRVLVFPLKQTNKKKNTSYYATNFRSCNRCAPPGCMEHFLQLKVRDQKRDLLGCSMVKESICNCKETEFNPRLNLLLTNYSPAPAIPPIEPVTALRFPTCCCHRHCCWEKRPLFTTIGLQLF